MDHVAAREVREALAEFAVEVPPETCRKIAVASLRLAAAMVALAVTEDREGQRGRACEMLLLLAEGPPELPPAA